MFFELDETDVDFDTLIDTITRKHHTIAGDEVGYWLVDVETERAYATESLNRIWGVAKAAHHAAGFDSETAMVQLPPEDLDRIIQERNNALFKTGASIFVGAFDYQGESRRVEMAIHRYGLPDGRVCLMGETRRLT